MIADSPYRLEGLLLPVPLGAGAGAVASAVMLGVFRVAGETGVVSTYLGRVGAVLPSGIGGEGARVFTGLAAHVLIGTLLGLLYAASQRTVPPRGLAAVGLFYGFFIWVGGGLLIGAFLGDALRATVRSWSFLFSSLVYGVTLAGVAFLWQALRQPVAATMAEPRD